MGPDSIDSIHQRLFAAVSGEVSFSSALRTVVDRFDAAAGVIFELDRKTGAFPNWIGCNVEHGEADYMEHLNTVNPRMRYSMRHAPGHVLYEGKFIDEHNMDRSEFYDWLGGLGLRYFLGSRVCDEGEVSLFHSVEFTPQHGHPDEDKLNAFKRVSSAIGNAWKASRHVGLSENACNGPTWAPDHLPWAIFAIRGDGAVDDMNAAARDLIESGTALSIEDGVLCACDVRSAERLNAVLERGLAGHSAETLLHCADPLPPLVTQVVPTNPARLAGPSNVVAVLYVWNPVQRSKRVADVWTRLYGFTQAEARLARALSSGIDLTAAAEQLGITRNTARNQMQSMFGKTGTRRQGEFLVRIWGVLDAE